MSIVVITGIIAIFLTIGIFLRGRYRHKIIFFIICFYAIMHRTTVVQNKIISMICSCLFFGLPNIYRPSLGKVWLGRPNPKSIQLLNFYLRKKKIPFYSELCGLQCIAPRFSILVFIYLKKIF